MTFTHEWWKTAEVLFAIASHGEGTPEDNLKAHADAVKAWRKGSIGRGNILRAKDFDAAARGVRLAMAGRCETLPDILERARWAIMHDIPPTFCRPVGWEWGPAELELARISRARGIDPVCLAFDPSGIDTVPCPKTTPNPWDKWRRL